MSVQFAEGVDGKRLSLASSAFVYCRPFVWAIYFPGLIEVRVPADGEPQPKGRYDTGGIQTHSSGKPNLVGFYFQQPVKVGNSISKLSFPAPFLPLEIFTHDFFIDQFAHIISLQPQIATPFGHTDNKTERKARK